jgi:outer membrane protein assembly factor BamD
MRYTRWACTELAIGLCLLFLWGTVGCGSPWKDLRPGSFERGKVAYDDGSYAEAIQDLKLFIRRNPTDERADEAQYYVGKADMELGDYPLAAVEFQILRADYPNSQFFEEAYYLEGMSYVEQVPSIAVDPTVVEQGIAHFTKFLRDFPDGKFSDDARKQLAALRLHMDRKKLEAAQLYERMGQTKAALVTVEVILQEHPDSQLGPDLLFMEGNLALQLDDRAQAREAFSQLVQKFPEHSLAKAAQRKLSKLDTTRGETGS